jgi:NitT/TauT family transport system substrate-binding protein
MKRLVLVLFSMLLATGAGAQDERPLTTVRVCYDGFSMTSGPMVYADKQGIFRRFGLDIVPTFVEGGTVLTQAVVDGSVDIAQNGYTPTIAAAVQGADTVIIGSIQNNLPYQFVVQNSVVTAADLKGDSIGISRFGSSTDAAADFALGALKLSRNDVKVIELGGAGRRAAAMLSGQIAGTFEQYPDTGQLTRHGFHVLIDVTGIAGEYPNSAFVTTRSYLKSHPDVVKNFLMAMATAIHEFKQNAAIAIPLMQTFLDVRDIEDMRVAYDAYAKLYPDIPRPSLKAIGLVLATLAKNEPKAAAMKPEQFVDTSSLDELEREGFFARLLATH